MKLATIMVAALAFVILAAPAHAQLELEWTTIDSGSMEFTGTTFELRSTIGQPDADETRNNYNSVYGGYWAFGYTFCVADVTTQGAGQGDPLFGVPDGTVSASDLNLFVNAWTSNDLSVADLTTTGASPGTAGFGVPDGSATAADLNLFVNVWATGCQ